MGAVTKKMFYLLILNYQLMILTYSVTPTTHWSELEIYWLEVPRDSQKPSSRKFLQLKEFGSASNINAKRVGGPKRQVIQELNCGTNVEKFSKRTPQNLVPEIPRNK